MEKLISSLIGFLLSIVQFIIMILISYVLEGLLFLFGGFGYAIRNYATNWRAAVVNLLGLAATIASVYYFLVAPLPTIFIITLVITNILSILGIRSTTPDDFHYHVGDYQHPVDTRDSREYSQWRRNNRVR